MFLYRADTRSPDDLINAGGFKPWDYPDKNEVSMRSIAISNIQSMYGKASGGELMSHVWGKPNPKLISTATTGDCMGQASKVTYKGNVAHYSTIYKLEFPNLYMPRKLSADLLGAPMRKIVSVLRPKLYLDSKFGVLSFLYVMALGQPAGEEVDFFSMIPLRFFKKYKTGGENTWHSFPKYYPKEPHPAK